MGGFILIGPSYTFESNRRSDGISCNCIGVRLKITKDQEYSLLSKTVKRVTMDELFSYGTKIEDHIMELSFSVYKTIATTNKTVEPSTNGWNVLPSNSYK
jgi:hypothetical protein